MVRITLFSGHYGSGKTTGAVAYAKKIKNENNKVMIVDIDLVNPYFRTKDAEAELERLGIKVISPTYANTNVEAPSIPPEIMAAFSQKDHEVVFDVGGDDDGGVVLGRFFGEFSQENYEFLLVINTKRPLTFDKKSIIIYKEAIEAASRLKFTGLVNATNISTETVVADILEGEKIINEVSLETGIPKKYNFVLPELMEKLPEDIKRVSIPVELFNKKAWEL